MNEDINDMKAIMKKEKETDIMNKEVVNLKTLTECDMLYYTHDRTVICYDYGNDYGEECEFQNKKRLFSKDSDEETNYIKYYIHYFKCSLDDVPDDVIQFTKIEEMDRKFLCYNNNLYGPLKGLLLDRPLKVLQRKV